jgi:hypothetical protein
MLVTPENPSPLPLADNAGIVIDCESDESVKKSNRCRIVCLPDPTLLHKIIHSPGPYSSEEEEKDCRVCRRSPWSIVLVSF